MQGAQLKAPALLPFELASIARKKILKHPGKGAAIQAGLGLALALAVVYVDVNQVEVVELALARGLSTYDASYLWVALRFDGLLLTFDRRLKAASERPAPPRKARKP